jgi:hypothetical protein
MAFPIIVAGNAARKAADSANQNKKFSIWRTLEGAGKGVLSILSPGQVDEIKAEPLLQSDNSSANTPLYLFAFVIVAAVVAVFFIAQRK